MKTLILTTATLLTIGITGMIFLESEAQAQPSAVTSSTSMFGDACKDVKFKVTNKHKEGGQIELRKVEYYNKANGKWQTEDIPNHVMDQGDTYTTSGDNLKDSEGEELTKIRFIYRWKDNRASSNWSDDVTSKDFTPKDATCNAGKIYGLGQGWDITG